MPTPGSGEFTPAETSALASEAALSATANVCWRGVPPARPENRGVARFHDRETLGLPAVTRQRHGTVALCDTRCVGARSYPPLDFGCPRVVTRSADLWVVCTRVRVTASGARGGPKAASPLPGRHP
jgi:hypothetical protein